MSNKFFKEACGNCNCEAALKVETLLRDNLTFFYRREILYFENLKDYNKMIFVDIKDLKCMNETQGYMVGDMCIMRTAMAILHSLIAAKVDDFIPIRFGGDELIVLLKHDIDWETFTKTMDKMAAYKLCPETYMSFQDLENQSLETIFFNLKNLKRGEMV